ncbi:AAC(3) family N-acetyltransferase [Paenibacillus koleovorans]|uniref:AAC(3) family N-acetyltransferase n=1 Tax=Paenibacillus koleovorans TaxID=121608 RepID=UPI000FD7F5D0|nr:AAC(3) family N-acetyltransferase [Paenibacillus koleovorans]
MLSHQTLVDSFRRLGIAPGSRLLVHSALRALGPVEGGAATVLDALLECVGPEGLIAVPTFTYFNETFDPETSPSRTGALTEILRKRSGAVRSLHPTHSIAAIGEGADELCASHHGRPGLGIDSPLDRIARSGGGILLLGVGHTSNSTVHVGEAHAGVPYLGVPFDPTWPTSITIKSGSDELTYTVHEHPGCSRAFGAIEASLRAKSSIRDAMIGKALVQHVVGQDVIASTVELLSRNPAALLCRDDSCYRCSRARAQLSASAAGS